MQFFCDVMLGRLAKYLRMLGIDTLYSRSISEASLIKTAANQNRTILTRRTKFLRIKNPPPFFFIKNNNPEIQLKEVINHFNINVDRLKPFRLCLLCNRALKDVDRNLVEGKVPEYIFNQKNRFSQCPNCHRIYWQGTHYKNMSEGIPGFFNVENQ